MPHEREKRAMEKKKIIQNLQEKLEYEDGL